MSDPFSDVLDKISDWDLTDLEELSEEVDMLIDARRSDED